MMANMPASLFCAPDYDGFWNGSSVRGGGGGGLTILIVYCYYWKKNKSKTASILIDISRGSKNHSLQTEIPNYIFCGRGRATARIGRAG